MSITIKKAKIKNELFLEVEYSEKLNDGTNTVKKECTAPVHDDLKLAFKRLNVHLALLCEQVYIATGKAGIEIQKGIGEEIAWQMDPNNDFTFSQPSWNIIRGMYCSGFTIGGSGESEGVTLIGYRLLGNDKVLNLTSPFQRWGDSYEFDSKLGEIIEACKHETYQYLFNDKHKPNAQLSMFDEDNENV
jgi:hypothetical protein